MSRFLLPFRRAFAAALLVMTLGLPLIAVGTALWSLNALRGIATWEKVGYEMGYHGTWLVIFSLAAGGIGLAAGMYEALVSRHTE